MIRPASSAGFMLLEALVVLVITSLVSVVLIQGFGLVLAARGSVESKLVEADQYILQRSLLLDPLRGVLPDYPEKPNIFKGELRSLHGLTDRPLQERMGAPVGFTMTIDYHADADETVVSYQEQGADAVAIARWPGNKGAFYYRDIKGGWSETWPPAQTAPDQTSQTPWLIRVEMGTGVPSSMIASVDGPHRRPIRMMDSPFATPASIK